MATLTQAILTYSYVDRAPIDFGTVNQDDPDIALLVRVNSLMSSAAAAFSARRYDEAISDYHAAESLIYSQLDPQWAPETGSRIRPVLSRNPALFEPLLSATSQWLNIVPVPTPASPVRPATPVDARLLGTVAKLDGAGLGVVSADPAAAAGAIADMHLAQIYAGQGNTAAATAAAARAKKLDPALAGSLEPKAPGSERNAPLARSPRPAAATVRATRVKGALAGQPIVVDAPSALPITVLAEKQAGLLTGVAGNYAVTPIQWPAGGSPAAA
jgi:hypothetical protein